MYINSICLFGQAVTLEKLARRKGGQQKRTRGKGVKMTQNGLTSTANGPFSKLRW